MRTVLTRTRPPSACRTASSGDNNASQNDVLRRREDSNVGTRIRLVDNEISAGTLDQTWFAEPRSGTPARGGQDRGGGQARLDELGGLPGNQAMRKGATSIGAQIDGHARVMCCRDSLIAARVQVSHVRRYETVAAAHDAGVTIYLGTDAGGSLPHGLVAREAAELVKAGLSTTAVLTASSWGARSWLRKPGLVEGASADLIVYQADPRADIRVLAAPEHIVLRGVVVP